MTNELAALVGRNIAAARQEQGIRTQGALAKKIHEVDPELEPNNTRVSIWERGAEKPSDRYMKALTAVLGKTPDWFYTDHNKPEEDAETPDLLVDLDAAAEPAWVSRLENKIDRVLDAQRELLVRALEALPRSDADDPPASQSQHRPQP